MTASSVAERLRRCRVLADVVAERAAESDPIVVVRHSVREAISAANLAAATEAALTDEGRDLARAFGGMLPVARGTRLFASPVGRCVETAELLVEALRARGGEARLLGTRSYLAGNFIVDPAPVVAAFAESGPRGFMKAWRSGALPASAIHPPARAAEELLEELLQERRGGGGGVDLHVGHDLTLATLLGLAIDTAGPGFRWPGYLEGVVLWRAEGGGVGIWHRGEVGMVSR